VVVFDRAIEAYVVLADTADAARLSEVIAGRLAAYKRPRAIHARDRLPRTATGKLVRDVRALRATGT